MGTSLARILPRAMVPVGYCFSRQEGVACNPAGRARALDTNAPLAARSDSAGARLSALCRKSAPTDKCGASRQKETRDATSGPATPARFRKETL